MEPFLAYTNKKSAYSPVSIQFTFPATFFFYLLLLLYMIEPIYNTRIKKKKICKQAANCNIASLSCTTFMYFSSTPISPPTTVLPQVVFSGL